MNKTVIIAVAVGAALLGVVALTLMLLSEQQDTRSRASEEQPLSLPSRTPTGTSAQTAQSCPAPALVSNVLVEYPNCIGETCNFDMASCSWNSVAGATKYKLTVTETDTETVIRDEEIEASITRVEFNINQGYTYKCDVAAINSCGAVGTAASHSLLCETDALIGEPTPIPTAPPSVACGFGCNNTSDCQSGLTCIADSNGQGYCAIPAFESACSALPSISTCCTAPSVAPTLPPEKPIVTNTPVPTIPASGVFDNTIAMGAGVILLLILGSLLLIF